MQETRVLSQVGKIPWRRKQIPTPVFWPEESHGLYSPWGHKELDTTKWLSFLLLHSWFCLSGDFGEESGSRETEFFKNKFYELILKFKLVLMKWLFNLSIFKDLNHTVDP